MPKFSSSGLLQQDEWAWLEEDHLQDGQPLPEGRTLVPLAYYQRNIQQSLKMGWGVWFDTEADVEVLREVVGQIPVIAIRFPAFTDGRGFSQARILRDHLKFKGELRAVGSFIQDQLFYMKRCGFDAFVVPEEADVESLKRSLNDFSDGYQADVNQPLPLFRRRNR